MFVLGPRHSQPPSPLGASDSSLGSNKRKRVQFNDDESISIGSCDTASDKQGWSDQSIAVSSVESEGETPPPKVVGPPAVSGILKRASSPTENLAKMVKESLNLDLKSPPKSASKTKKSSKKGDALAGKIFFPHVLYVWKDSIRNRMMTLELHLPSATSEKEVEFHLLENSDGGHTLSVKYKYSELFLSKEIFEDNCELKLKKMDVNSVNRMASRADHLLALRTKTSGQANTDRISASQEFVLPFRVENIFNLPIGTKPYAGTGTEFRAVPIMGENEDTGQLEKETEMVILFVTLVDEDKIIKHVKENTPSKTTRAKQYKRI